MKLTKKEKTTKETNVDKPENAFLNKADHAKLLKCVGLKLSKNEPPVKKQKRSEASRNVSLFSMLQVDKSGSNTKLDLDQLLKKAPKSETTSKLKRKIKQVESSSNQLSAPLPKPISERIQRKVEYKKTSEDIGKWDPIVQKNRKASHLSFPLNQEPFRVKTVDQFFKTKSKFLTPLEKEMHALLTNNKCVERPDHDLTVMEEEALAAMSLEEAKARLNELRKHRALLSYHEAKSKRQKKIKSRHYHRMIKKQRQKENSKLPAMEENPDERDKHRAMERATLRHRKGSKWSMNAKRVSAKNNEKLKFDLEEQSRKHAQLVEKQVQSESEEDETAQSEDQPMIDFFNALKPLEPVSMPSFAKNNPWLRNTSNSKFVENKPKRNNNVVQSSEKNAAHESEESSPDEPLTKEEKKLKEWLNSSGLQSDTAENNKQKFKNAVSRLAKLNQDEDEEMAEEDVDADNVRSRSLDTHSQEEGLLEETMQMDEEESNMVFNCKPRSKQKKSSIIDSNGEIIEKSNIDFSHVSSSNAISRLQPKAVENDEESQKITIEEAFADDDVLNEFKAEKNETTNKNKDDANLDQALPGWGSWSGIGTKKKRKKMNKKTKGERRRDSNLGHVILNDKRDAFISKHQVHSLPYPFVTKEQFEGSIARPVGGTWNTPEIFSAAIKPAVVSSMGTIIQPMNSNELPAEQNKTERKFQSKDIKKGNF